MEEDTFWCMDRPGRRINLHYQAEWRRRIQRYPCCRTNAVCYASRAHVRESHGRARRKRPKGIAWRLTDDAHHGLILAVALTVGGVVWLLFQLFIADEFSRYLVAGAIVVIATGAHWLWTEYNRAEG